MSAVRVGNATVQRVGDFVLVQLDGGTGIIQFEHVALARKFAMAVLKACNEDVLEDAKTLLGGDQP